MANVDACISPQLFVALPLTGFAIFLAQIKIITEKFVTTKNVDLTYNA